MSTSAGGIAFVSGTFILIVARNSGVYTSLAGITRVVGTCVIIVTHYCGIDAT